MTATPPNMGRIGELVAHAMVRSREALRPHERAHADARVTDWLDRFEDDMKAAALPLLSSYIDDETVPAEVRDLLAGALGTEHATGVTLLFEIVGSLFYQLVSAAMTGPSNAIAQTSLRNDPNTPLTPAEIADGMLRHNPHIATPYDEALRSGVVKSRLDALEYNAGNALPPGELLELFRRGLIDEARLATGVHQDRLRDEWLPELLMLRFEPPSVGTIVNARLKQRIDDAAYLTGLARAGMDPVNAGWLLDSAGRPYGIEQALHLLNRGEIGEARVRDVIAHSDVNPIYADDILKLRVYVPPVRSIMAMLRAGARTDAEATALFKENGVRDQDIPAYLTEAHHTRASAVKELSQSTVIRMYANGLLTHAEASARLVALGYQATDTTLLLAFADDVKRERYANALISKMHSLYVSHKASDTEVHSTLAADQLDATLITELLHLWKLERDANVHVPTVPQVLHAYRQKAIGAIETKTRLLGLGVLPADLAIVVTQAWPPTKYERVLVDAVVNA